MLVFTTHIVFAKSLTLKEAQQAALLQSPELKSLQAKSNALGQTAIAAGQLSDPKLMLGAMNVPVDTFRLNQAPMTQMQVGLMQTFPRGHSLRYKSAVKQDLSKAEFRKQALMRLEVLRDVRLDWINLYYWIHANKIVQEQKKIFQHLLKVTQSMLANNKTQQKDVIRAQLELIETDNKLIAIQQNIKTVRARLGRWIGTSLAEAAQPQHLPHWINPPKLSKLEKLMSHHPRLKIDAALVSSHKSDIKLAQQQYKPSFTVGVAYGFRQGNDPDGQKRSDFLTAQVSMDLALFTRNRQDRTLKASQANLLASKENQISDYRQLLENLKTQYSIWQEQKEQSRLYQKKLVPTAKEYAQATMKSYQNVQTDFPTLSRAFVRELNTKLNELKAAVQQSIARANLLYLQGR